MKPCYIYGPGPFDTGLRDRTFYTLDEQFNVIKATDGESLIHFKVKCPKNLSTRDYKSYAIDYIVSKSNKLHETAASIEGYFIIFYSEFKVPNSYFIINVAIVFIEVSVLVQNLDSEYVANCKSRMLVHEVLES